MYLSVNLFDLENVITVKFIEMTFDGEISIV